MKNPKKMWELICYFGGILGFILTSIISAWTPVGSVWMIVLTVFELLFMAAICVGCVLGVIRTKKFNMDNALRIAVLIVIATDFVTTILKMFR